MDAVGPDIADIDAAMERLRGRVVSTPLLEAHEASRQSGRRVLVKAEVLQLTGTFKIRGALTFLDLLDAGTRQSGVVAYSSGNHGQGVAAAAAMHRVGATVVMPAAAPAIKSDRTRRWGARIVTYGAGDDREEIAREIAEESGATLVPPYDHPWIIAGQGTLGVELAEQCVGRGVEAPSVVVPAGGGGLVAGVAIALADRLPSAGVYAVEPEGWDDHVQSLAIGERVRVAGVPSICDALLAATPGAVTFPINRDLLTGAFAVPDAAVLRAMGHAFRELKLVAEPGGAVGLAAALEGIVPGDGPIVVVLSGGNVDGEMFREALG